MSVSSRYVTMVLVGLSLIALTSVAVIAPVPYGYMQPGPAFNTLGHIGEEPLFGFGDDVDTYEVGGALLFTTVSVSRKETDISLTRAISIALRPHTALVANDVLHPHDITDEESNEIAQFMMEQSQVASEVAGVRAAGYEIEERAFVVDAAEGSPADGLLQENDQLVGFNGSSTVTSQAFVAAVQGVAVGDDVTISVIRDGEELDVTMTTVASDDDPEVPRIGVTIRPEFDMPIEIRNNVSENGQQIGGPSAGLMFALAIYDHLTPGFLTGGMRIAGTGEITTAGEVLGVGGVRQKMAGAAESGARVFLVPADNCSAANAGTDFDMIVLKIEHLGSAIAALESFASAIDDAGAELSQSALRDVAHRDSLPLC